MMTLADYRKNAGYGTQEQFSLAAGVERGTVAKWEVGERYPRPQMLPMLARLLKVSEGDIIQAITAAKK